MAKQTFTTGQVLTAAQMTSLQQTAMLGGAASAKVASYVLVAADAGDAITMSNAGATTITVNTGLFATGDIVTIINIGAGACTITAGTATVTTSGSLVLAQNQGGVLRFTSPSAAIFLQFATPASGDIEGVTAGTGISGGGTSGTVTITNSMATAIDAKGDLIAGTGADAFSRLAVGTNDQILVADSTAATGLKWATPASGGGMTVIATGSLSGTPVTISSIPQTYVDLQLVISGATWNTTTAQFAFRYNGSSVANSYKTYLNGAYGTASNVQSTYEWSEINDLNRVYINGEWNRTDTLNNQTITFENYTAAKYPVIRYEASYMNNLGFVTFAHGVFSTSNAAAITSISMLMTSSLSFTGGTYTLYGVK
jgi:hypothetical protein